MALETSWVKTVLCVVALGAGCVDESYAPEETAEARRVEPRPSEGSGEAVVIDVETLDVTLPAKMHAQGIALPAKLVRPKWSKAVGARPAVLVLHGSGGLLRTPKKKGGKQVCLSEMEPQYETWSRRLAEQGFTVLLPSSYSARGFCDKHDDIPRMPETFDDKPEQIVSRIYDTDVAARYLCALPEVDCDRMAVMGFSQGGTMTMLALHWQTERAIRRFRESKGEKFDIEIPDLPPGRPDFKVGIAYYPGCGFDGVVPLATEDDAALEDLYMPTAPLTILHATEDPLIKHCSREHGVGTRAIQAELLAEELDVADLYEIEVYEGAEHGFDHLGEKGKAKGGANEAAAEAALALTLDRLAEHLE